MRHLWLATLALVVSACGRTQQHEAAGDVVDSVLPMDVMLTRFRQDLPRSTELHGGLDSRDSLVARVIAALKASDTLALGRLAVNRSEWAWLYFPTNVLARPPYELPPALAWFRLQEANRQGVLRALRELGGHRLDYRGYQCDAEPTVEDANRIWTGCIVTLARDGPTAAPIRLFSAILEREGRFLVLSYANDF